MSKWDNIENVGNGSFVKKVDLSMLPRYEKGTYVGKVDWTNCAGREIPILYDNKEYVVIVKKYVSGKNPYVLVDIKGFNEMGYKVNISHIGQCAFGGLVNNIYANPNIPNRELIIRALGEEEAKKIGRGKEIKIDVKCPVCGNEHGVWLFHLTKKQYSCQYCGDGVSYPERLMGAVLTKLGVNFKKGITFNGGKQVYDFYLPDHNAILETHGIQHYKRSFGTRTVEEEQKNDQYKLELAIENGIKEEDYHQINCMKSTLKWCRQNIELALEKYFDTSVLTDKDWCEIDKASQPSVVVDVCKYYNENGGSIRYIGRLFGVSSTTIARYLRKGTELGICKYNGNKTKIIGIHRETGETISFDKLKDGENFGFTESGISNCINGKTKHHKGYVWFRKKY